MNFLERAVELDSEIIEHRRWLHQRPELAFEEKESTAYILKNLEKLGIDCISFPDYYGVIGLIQGGKPGATVVLRADIDALPMAENSGESFAADNGCMHACGHDCHAAMLLGAARLLVERREELCGTVKLLFQSGEEGFTGSRYYVDKGYLEGSDAIFGMHVWGSLAAPLIDISDGPRMAACDNFVIRVHGNGSHGSTPHLAKDVIPAASSIILNLQTLASRLNDPVNPLVLTIGTFRSGTQFNIIPGFAELEGTMRTFSREIRETVESRMRQIIEHSAQALGCTAELEYTRIDSPIINEDTHMNDIARKAAVKLFGEKVLHPMEKVLGADDFAYLLEHYPGLYCFIGCLNEEKGIIYPNHSDKFRVDEDILHRGAALYAQFAADFLRDREEGK